MFCPQILGSVSTNMAGECPEVSLKTSNAFTLTDGIWNSQVSGLSTLSPSCNSSTIVSFYKYNMNKNTISMFCRSFIMVHMTHMSMSMVCSPVANQLIDCIQLQLGSAAMEDREFQPFSGTIQWRYVLSCSRCWCINSFPIKLKHLSIVVEFERGTEVKYIKK